MRALRWAVTNVLWISRSFPMISYGCPEDFLCKLGACGYLALALLSIIAPIMIGQRGRQKLTSLEDQNDWAERAPKADLARGPKRRSISIYI